MKWRVILLNIIILFSFNSFAASENVDMTSKSEYCERYLNSAGKADNEDIIKCTFDEMINSNKDTNQVMQYDRQSDIDLLLKGHKQFADDNVDTKYYFYKIIYASMIISIFISVFAFLRTNQIRKAIDEKMINRFIGLLMTSPFLRFNLSLILIGLSLIIALSFVRSMIEVDISHVQDNAVSIANYDNQIKIHSNDIARISLSNAIARRLETNRTTLLGYDIDEIPFEEFAENNELHRCLSNEDNFNAYSFDNAKMSYNAYKLVKCQSVRGSGLVGDKFTGYVYNSTGAYYNDIEKQADLFAEDFISYYCGINKLGFDQGSQKNKTICMSFDGVPKEEFVSREELLTKSYAYFKIVDSIFKEYVYSANVKEFENAIESNQKFKENLSKEELEEYLEFKNDVYYKRMNPLESMFKMTLLSIYDNFNSESSETFFRDNVLNGFTVDESKFFGNQRLMEKTWNDEMLTRHKHQMDLIVNELYTTEVNREESLFDGFDKSDLFIAKHFLQACIEDTEGNDNCKTLLKVNHAATDLVMTQLGAGASLKAVGVAGRKGVEISSLSDSKKQSWLAKFKSIEDMGDMFLSLSMTALKALFFIAAAVILIIYFNSIKALLLTKLVAIGSVISGNIQLKEALLKITLSLFFNVYAFFITYIAIHFFYSVFFDSVDSYIDYFSALQFLEVNQMSLIAIISTYAFYPISIVLVSGRVNRFIGVEIDNIVKDGKEQLSLLSRV